METQESSEIASDSIPTETAQENEGSNAEQQQQQQQQQDNTTTDNQNGIN